MAASAGEGEARTRRGRGGAEARRAARRGGPLRQMRHIERKPSVYEVLTEEGLEIIEHNADTVIEEIGIEFREDTEMLSLWKEAGADVRHSRERFARDRKRAVVGLRVVVQVEHGVSVFNIQDKKLVKIISRN